MASVDPYAPCPCGSGNKFKWCCQKIEAHADRAQRLFESGQVEGALAALDEGLARAPGNAWLSLRKAMVLSEEGRAAEARPLVAGVVRAQPKHLGAQALLVRLVLETEGPKAAIDQLQHALTNVEPEHRARLAPMAQLIGAVLGRLGFAPGARKHLRLSKALQPGGPNERSVDSLLQSQANDPRISPWMRDEHALAPAPEGLGGEARERFEQGRRWADEGLWSTAAAAFDALEAQGVAGADLNLGLCRLWLMDLPGAIEALRRAIRRLGPTTEAVELEALCQLMEGVKDADRVEQVHLIWTLRDRDGLLAALGRSDRTQDAGEEPLEPDDPESFPVRVFEVLDRPRPSGEFPTEVGAWPRVVGRTLVGREIAILEAYDDGQLDRLSSWFTDLAGPALPPAQPRTKVVDHIARSDLALRSDLWIPDDLPEDRMAALRRQELARLVNDVWPETPLAYLGGRSPRQAASDGAYQVAIRAALARFEHEPAYKMAEVNFDALRARLGIPPESTPDPATVDIGRLSLSQLDRVPAGQLDDDRLVALYKRAQETGMATAAENAARALVERPELLDRSGIGRFPPYSDLALLSLVRDGREAGFRWLEQGRQGDPNARGASAVLWDMLDVRLRSLSEPPETWVPHLAVVLERHREGEASMPYVLSHLVDMGLVRMIPHPDQPGQILLDSRPLQSVLAEYGPRITTAAGTLGVSASQGGIWTPDAAAGSTSSGGIWTPGAPREPGGGDKPKIIIPGR